MEVYLLAKEKLEEAKFFLEKLHASTQLLPQDLPTQRESHYYLSAFLSASVSAIDYVLEDYNVKFSLHIPLTKKWLRSAFEKEAKRLDNKAALAFLEWWREKRKDLENDSIGRLVIGKRHIDIHRVQTKPDLAKIQTGDGIVLSSGSLEIKVFREGKLVETRKALEQPPLSPKATKATFDWFFSEYPGEPMMSVCEKFLDKVDSFVSEAVKRFP